MSIEAKKEYANMKPNPPGDPRHTARGQKHSENPNEQIIILSDPNNPRGTRKVDLDKISALSG